MSQKKCPKCGEMNPAEAVMCWACYTPLTGGAAAAGGGTATMTAAPATVATKKNEKKAIAPWQLGVVALAVVLALGLGASQMFGGASVDEGEVTGPIPKPAGTSGGRSTASIETAVVQLPIRSGGGQTTMPVKEALKYSVVSPPNPELPWGVVAIVPTDPNTSPQQAAGMATFAHQQFGGTKKWKAMQIFVFRTREAALPFTRFQIGRRSDVLTHDDYAGLTNLWPDCIASYEANGQAKPDIRNPSQRPISWWRGEKQS